MASRKSVVDDCTKILLRVTAGAISRDQRYRAPSLDRESIAAILSKAHQFALLSPVDTTKKIHDLEMMLRRRASEAIKAHVPTDDVVANHPLLVLEQVLIMQIAIDEAASALMLERANKSKGFASYLKPDQNAATRSVFDHLVDVLGRPSVRSQLLEEKDLTKETLDGFIGALTIKETRLFTQRFIGNSPTMPLPEAPPADDTAPKPKRGRAPKVPEQKASSTISSEPLAAPIPVVAVTDSAEHEKAAVEAPPQPTQTGPTSPATMNDFDKLLNGFYRGPRPSSPTFQRTIMWTGVWNRGPRRDVSALETESSDPNRFVSTPLPRPSRRLRPDDVCCQEIGDEKPEPEFNCSADTSIAAEWPSSCAARPSSMNRPVPCPHRWSRATARWRARIACRCPRPCPRCGCANRAASRGRRRAVQRWH